MAMLRLVLRQYHADADGRLGGTTFYTADVQVPDELQGLEIVGGEWMQPRESRELGLAIKENWTPEPRDENISPERAAELAVRAGRPSSGRFA